MEEEEDDSAIADEDEDEEGDVAGRKCINPAVKSLSSAALSRESNVRSNDSRSSILMVVLMFSVASGVLVSVGSAGERGGRGRESSFWACALLVFLSLTSEEEENDEAGVAESRLLMASRSRFRAACWLTVAGGGARLLRTGFA